MSLPIANPVRESAVSRCRYAEGDVIAGRYELVRRIGEGGMGVVWVARSRGLGVDVALKLLHAASADAVAVERMAREARAAARLGHAAIVRVLDFGTTESGQPFMAMELLDGEDLFRILRRTGRLSAVEAVSLILPIVDALVVAHEHGIVHRDLKPENIFVATDTRGRVEPKILDFGIAKLEAVDDKRLTQVGTILGSPAYLSPEQAEGADDVDCRGDIWSLGVVLYELVTGRLPFDGKTSTAVLRSIAEHEPRPTVEFAAGNDALWSIIRRCLRKDPLERWSSMHALGEALARWLLAEGMNVDVSSRSLRETWLPLEASSKRLRLAAVRSAPDAASAAGDGLPDDTVSVRPGDTRATQIRPRSDHHAFGRTALAAGLLALCAIVVGHELSIHRTSTRGIESPPAAVVRSNSATVDPRPAPSSPSTPTNGHAAPSTPATNAESATSDPSTRTGPAPGSAASTHPGGASPTGGARLPPAGEKKTKPARITPRMDAEFGF